MTLSSKLLLKVLAVLAMAFWGQGAVAQSYPDRPITMVNPYAAGGAIDITARFVEPIMSRELGQQIVMENRTGGNGFIGGSIVARSNPDGYTLLVTASGPVLNTLNQVISYDPKTAFQPVGRVVTTPAFVVVAENSPIKSLAQLVSMGKDGKHVTYAHSGIGTGTHMAAGLFAVKTGATFTAVPYRGTGPQVTDLIAGTIDFCFLPAGDALPRLGKGLRALAVTTVQRSSLAPDVPTVAEAGVPNYEFSQWYGMFVPSATPRPIVEKVNAALAKALRDEGIKARFLDFGLLAEPISVDEFTQIVKQQAEIDRAIAIQLGIIQ